MAQMAKIFMMNTARSGGTMIDIQINKYLAEHTNHRLKTVSYVVVGMVEKALVIFEYPDAKTQEIKDSAVQNNGKHKYLNQIPNQNASNSTKT